MADRRIKATDLIITADLNGREKDRFSARFYVHDSIGEPLISIKIGALSIQATPEEMIGLGKWLLDCAVDGENAFRRGDTDATLAAVGPNAMTPEELDFEGWA